MQLNRFKNFFAGSQSRSNSKQPSQSDTSRISTASMRRITENLRLQKHKNSTKTVYFSIWRKFNKFVIRLDDMPPTWEERTSLYVGYLADTGTKSSTIKTYISAIKSVLADDKYEWNEADVQFTALTRACRLTRDRVKIRLPITHGLLDVLLNKLEDIFLKRNQNYLLALYQCLFILAYYGLMRIGELAKGSHPVRAKDIHCGKNKRKVLIILFTSKTHGLESYPQQIRIWADFELRNITYCPFKITSEFSNLRGGYMHDFEQFFIFQDRSPVLPAHVRSILRKALNRAGLDSSLYDTHSFRIGRATDLMRSGYTVDQIKLLGRWKSNAVFKYIRDVNMHPDLFE